MPWTGSRGIWSLDICFPVLDEKPLPSCHGIFSCPHQHDAHFLRCLPSLAPLRWPMSDPGKMRRKCLQKLVVHKPWELQVANLSLKANTTFATSLLLSLVEARVKDICCFRSMTEQKKKKRNGLQCVLPLGYACANRKGALLFFFRFPFSSLRHTLTSPIYFQENSMLHLFLFLFSFLLFLLLIFLLISFSLYLDFFNCISGWSEQLPSWLIMGVSTKMARKG